MSSLLAWAVYCYLAIAVFYSSYVSNQFKDLDVPVWRIILYSLFCPYFLITYCICRVLEPFGIHIMIVHTMEVNGLDNKKPE